MICFKNLKGSSTMAYFTDNFKEIEAVQFINAASEELKEAFNNYPKWLDDALEQGVVDCIFPMNKPVYLRVSTREGEKDAIEGDWIIRNGEGELYLVKN
jgi:hypothetical protein